MSVWGKMAMDLKSEVKDITELNLKDIPEKCSRCLYWSFAEETEKTSLKVLETNQESTQKKKQWILQTLNEFGSCGKILYCNEVPLAYAEYGPSNRFPRIQEYKSQPIGKKGEGVVFLSCLFISDENLRRKGLGEKLLDNIIASLKERGFKAVEAYPRVGSSNNPSGPVELYLKKGFYVKDDSNPEFPIVRLDL